MIDHRGELDSRLVEQVCVAVYGHQSAMHDEGYTREADVDLWSALDQAKTAEQVRTAVAEHRLRIGFYSLSADEELWETLYEVLMGL